MKEDHLRAFCAGVILSAKRGDDGLLHPYNEGEPIAEFPETIALFGNTYGLEHVDKACRPHEEATYA